MSLHEAEMVSTFLWILNHQVVSDLIHLETAKHYRSFPSRRIVWYVSYFYLQCSLTVGNVLRDVIDDKGLTLNQCSFTIINKWARADFM